MTWNINEAYKDETVFESSRLTGALLVQSMVMCLAPIAAASWLIIRANRMAHSHPVRLSNNDDGGRLQLIHPDNDPHQQLERDELACAVDEELNAELSALEPVERRLLYMLYDQALPIAEITRRAAAGQPGMAGLDDANRCYYLKDRALRRMGDRILARLKEAGHEPQVTVRRSLLQSIEDLLRYRGIPMEAAGRQSRSPLPVTS